ncbi:uncharacterized protein TNCV_4863191 [Trichonephila clavipes]|nr:uncharacterized protein TNCV_4863191 [Trichonephila clavipes]
MECHSELVEALGNNALPYRTVARRIGKFQKGRLLTSDEQRSGDDRSVYGPTWHVIEQLMDYIKEGEHPGGGQGPPNSRGDLRLAGYLKYPHAAKALYIYKHLCLLRDSNPVPTAQQLASLATIPDGRHLLELVCDYHYCLEPTQIGYICPEAVRRNNLDYNLLV